MQRLGNTWRFFDPNAGEFRCEDTIEFMAYIDWYARRAGYRELFTTETSVYCVNPPPYINADALKARTGS